MKLYRWVLTLETRKELRADDLVVLRWPTGRRNVEEVWRNASPCTGEGDRDVRERRRIKPGKDREFPGLERIGPGSKRVAVGGVHGCKLRSAKRVVDPCSGHGEPGERARPAWARCISSWAS